MRRNTEPPDMAATPRTRIRALRELIAHHDRRSHAEDRTDIPDEEFDELFRELQKLEREFPDLVSPDSPTQRVGFRSSSGFAEVRHALPMLSITNATSEKEIADFVKGIETELAIIVPWFSAEPK